MLQSIFMYWLIIIQFTMCYILNDAKIFFVYLPQCLSAKIATPITSVMCAVNHPKES